MASGPVATGPDALIPYRWQAGCDQERSSVVGL